MTTLPGATEAVEGTSAENQGWHKGTSLLERARRLAELPPGTPAEVQGDATRAARRLARWRARPPLDRNDVFAKRLALDGLTEEQLLRLLGEPAETLVARHGPAPEWQQRLTRLAANTAADEARLARMMPGMSQATATFAVLVEPLMVEMRTRLVEALKPVVARYPAAPFEPEGAADLCVPYLGKRLLLLISRTLVLELNVAREEGRLQGNSAEERFRSFAQSLRQPEVALALFAEYPVLARRLVITADGWLATCQEMLERLAADRELIRERLGQTHEPDRLSACNLGVGDAHKGGRAVAILGFASGLRVVYKPRSLAVDVHFHQLVEWLNARGATPPLRALSAIDRGTHGWVEFVEQRACTTREEVTRFYARLGGLLALTYALEATDVHFENIIAVGEDPCLVDLESLFHPHFAVGEVRGADDLASRAKADSVMRMGLLPRRGWAEEGSEGIDFSALGSTGGQLTPRAAQIWTGTGTDEMRITRQRVEVTASANRPTLNGQDVSVLDFNEPFQEGFARMYRLLLANREALIASDGPLERFAQDETRVILRPTYFYHLLERESTHPDHLRDGLDLDRFLDRLWGTMDQIPYTEPLISHEREDLWRNDVPFFGSRPNSCDVWSSAGQKLAGFFPRSGLELSRDRLRRFSEEGLTRQLWFIRASFTSLSVLAGGGRMPRYELEAPREPLSRERLLEKANALGDRLAELAFRGQGDASWLGLMPVGERYWTLNPLDVDLYSGLSGIMLFLAYLGHLTGQPRHTALARETLATVRRRVGNASFTPRQVGATGELGVIHALVHLGALWDQPALWDEAEALLPRLGARITEDTRFDVFTGAAGCIALMLELHRCRPSPRALAVAVQCGERLLAAAQSTEHGLGWVTPLGPRPLTGFSHGAAGIAWSLFALGAETGDTRFREAALRALAYERAEFSPEQRNWKDLRATPAEGGFMTALCHGAPGVGLGRVLSLPYLDTPEVREELRVAVETTQARGFGGNHCLCHGDFGNLEVLVLAAQALANPELARERDRLAASIVDSLDRVGVLCGVPAGVETPGLMSGLAGIGYALLRLAEPARTPSLLSFEPPRGA
ncbi:type 2 lanthipeptide synthetase LanM family protein [Hyalangium versicolor]|uniref:type 2 lanthipeptide synthetase LanM family protein n=1 Tax=Hyalangium versicolor TaxID=2861190 RepID=UPI001CCEC9E1|nr:type 2 lanthipeptide synthetase LanM family protein [Hyalangium versicolor]